MCIRDRINTTQQSADVIASLSEVQRLTEHLQTGDGGAQTVSYTHLDVYKRQAIAFVLILACLQS